MTRHICVEGWSEIGKWGGVRLSEFLKRVGAGTTAKDVGFQCGAHPDRLPARGPDQ